MPPNRQVPNVNGLYTGDKTRDDYLINLCLRPLILQFVVEREKCSSNTNPIIFSAASVPLPNKKEKKLMRHHIGL